MSYLLCIETVTPGHVHTQRAVEEFYSRAQTSADPQIKRKIKAVSHKSGIQSRYSVINDFSSGDGSAKFFKESESEIGSPGIDRIMEVFRPEALRLSLEAVNKIKGFDRIKHQITNVITVTCTGLFAPGLEIELIQDLGLRPDVERASINFMGCNAALLALKQADHICRANKDALVLIVCTEICTIHFQNDCTEDYILSNMLFGDGSAAVIVGKKKQTLLNYPATRIRSFHSLIVPDSKKAMAWQVTKKGFIMNLTSYVSGLLNSHVREMLLLQQVNPENISHWAIHPGGKKILDDFRATLGLSREALVHSYAVLEKYGNMSSATILFVLQKLITGGGLKKKEKIYTAAFGPGLTIESAILEYV